MVLRAGFAAGPDAVDGVRHHGDGRCIPALVDEATHAGRRGTQRFAHVSGDMGIAACDLFLFIKIEVAGLHSARHSGVVAANFKLSCGENGIHASYAAMAHWIAGGRAWRARRRGVVGSAIAVAPLGGDSVQRPRNRQLRHSLRVG